MVSFQTWVILILIVVAWAQYTIPDKASPLTSKAWDPINGFIKADTWATGNTQPTTTSDGCPTNIDYVCGSNGVTYDNSCKAAMADVLEVTPGAC